MKKSGIILILCVCVHVAQGGVIVLAPDSGWVDGAGIGGEEYPWGATAGNMDSATGDWELGIGSDHAMNEETACLDWGGLETPNLFLLDYDPSRPERALWAIDGKETGLLDLTPVFSDMSISNTTFTVEGFVTRIDDFAAGYGETAKPQYMHINYSDGQLSDMDFVLEGNLYIDWTGAVPSRDEMGIYVKMIQIPEPASILLVAMVSGLGLFIRRKFGS